MPKLENEMIFCRYKKKSDRMDLKRMLLDPNFPIVNSGGYNIKKGKHTHLSKHKMEWIGKKGFVCPYGTFTFEDTMNVLFNHPDFDFKDFFKEKNMYVVFIYSEKEVQGKFEINYYPRITWINRKGYINKSKTKEQ